MNNQSVTPSENPEETPGETPVIEIYTSPFCGYCSYAKGLLDRKGVEYKELDVMMAPDLRQEMTSRSGGKTSVPQIFFDDQLIGGCDELVALEQAGTLDAKLGLT